ncbi:protein ENTREP2 isoform X2 [Pristis pectinata]|nr:protein ENTREP2 isoform X2 [Pristis pectinata]
MLLSAVCVLLNLAGSILSCQNGQMVISLQQCRLYMFDRDGVCICCEIQEPGTGCSAFSETLKLKPVRECSAVRLALKDLLFSICALNVISTIVCALSSALCCMQMVTADVIQLFIPQRRRAADSECVASPGTFLQQPLDFDEFISPIPPPPYYPPEYTHSPENESQRGLCLDPPHPSISARYSVAINSPSSLFPAELPPPYEAVARQTSASQGSLLSYHSLETSHMSTSHQSERKTSAAFGTRVDSGLLLLSEAADVPENSGSPGECYWADGCPGNTRAMIVTCQCGTCPEPAACRNYRTFLQSPHKEEDVTAPTHRCPGWHEHRLTERVNTVVRKVQPPVQEQATISSLKQIKSCCGFFRQFPSLHISGSARNGQQARRKSGQIFRSRSDPSLCSSREGEKYLGAAPGDAAQSVVPGSQTSCNAAAPPGPCSLTCSCSKHFHPVNQQKDEEKVGKWMKQQTLWEVPSQRPHSFLDLTTYKDTKILVAKFLEHSDCSLPPEVQHVVNSIRSVINLDEWHMEEAIYSASVNDQVMTSSHDLVAAPRLHLQEDPHLQSYGDLGSSSVSCYNLHGRRIEAEQPHGLIGVSRETIL